MSLEILLEAANAVLDSSLQQVHIASPMLLYFEIYIFDHPKIKISSLLFCTYKDLY